MMDTEELRALRDRATKGPWGMETVRTSCGVCHKIGPWPHAWRHGQDMSACIYDDYPSPAKGTDAMLANAALIALAPDLLDEVLRLRADATEAALQYLSDIGQMTEKVAALRDAAALVAEQFGTAAHVAHSIETGVFPEQSDIRDAIAAAIRRLPALEAKP